MDYLLGSMGKWLFIVVDGVFQFAYFFIDLHFIIPLHLLITPHP